MPKRSSSLASSNPLPARANDWVNRTLALLGIDDALAHLICPEDRKYTLSDWESIFRKVPLSCLFGDSMPVAELQKLARQPLLVAADLEHGAGTSMPDCTDFPWAFAVGAANSLNLTRRMGVASAIEARNKGINWTFSPCIDLCLNYNNPVVNVRSMGDNPERVARLATAWIQSMQKNGLAACAKHFPGDGVDDRDQHLCTSINSLDKKTWDNTYGKVWRAVIDGGVMSIMPGHISLPAFQGPADSPADCLPATLSSELQNDLLRGRLGFQGVIVSDAAPMIGFTSRVREEDAVVQNILTGSDVFLFADPVADFGRLKAAWKKGLLSEERIHASVRRILAMKARLGLDRTVARPKLTVALKKSFQADAARLAEKSIVLYRKNAATPVKLKQGAKVLTVTLRYEKGHKPYLIDLPFVDEELRRRGFEVTQWLNPSHREMATTAKEFDAVFVNFSFVPHAMMGTVRVIGISLMALWRAFWLECPQAVFTTFGSPYHLHEFPHLPNYWMVCSQSAVSQRAAVRAWLGEIRATGTCPIAMPGSKRVANVSKPKR